MNKRALILAAVLAAGTLYFWTSSRYPQLREKQESGDRVRIGEVLSHHPLIKISPDSPLPTRIAVTTINWLDTNKKGMTFGIFFGAAAIALLGATSILSRRRAPVRDAILGIAIGAPLGVCVNCAVPIGRGLRAGGSSAETMLAVIHSSPTLNIVVLSMVWSLFPPEFGIMKVGLTLLLVVAFVPLLVRWSGGQELRKPEGEIAGCAVAIEPREGWWSAVRGAVVSFARALFFIIKTTVPMMILAGFLGAIVAELLPGPTLVHGGGVFALFAVAIIGTFLPVPMAFDVVLAFILWRAGLPDSLTMCLLFTLGTFSVLPFAVLWRQISRRLAVGAFATVAVLGIVGGAVLEPYRERQVANMLELADHELAVPTVGALISRLCGRYSAADEQKRCARELNASVLVSVADAGLCDELDASHAGVCRGRMTARTSTTPGGAACLELADTRAQVECVEAYVSRRLAEGTGGEVCTLLRDETKIVACHEDAATRAALAGDHGAPCFELDDVAQRNRCLTRLTRSRLDRGAGVEACDLFSEQEARDQCRAGVVEGVAADSGDRNLCRQAKFPAERRRCERSIVERKIALGADRTACAELGRKADVRACESQVIAARIARGEDAAICEELREEVERDRCLRLAAVSRPVVDEGLAFCRRIKSPLVASECSDALRLRAAREQKDPALCSRLLAARARELCADEVVFARAIERRASAECERLGDRQLKARCTSALLIARAVELADPAACRSLADERERAACNLRVLARMADLVAHRVAGEITEREWNLLAGEPEPTNTTPARPVLPFTETAPAVKFTTLAIGDPKVYRVETTSLAKRTAASGPVFERLEARELGIDLGNDTDLLDFIEPQCHGRGLAAADLDNDGWIDLAFATRHGPRLYRGIGPRGFAPMTLDAQNLADKDTLAVAFADIDGDGAQDLFASTLALGHYFVRNQNGRFLASGIGHLRDDDSPVIRGISFADLDRDGFLDFVLGAWKGGNAGRHRLYMNRGGTFEVRPLDSKDPAFALTALFSDLDDDGDPDLLLGNDFETPDLFYTNDQTGKLSPIPTASAAVPFTPIHTMSYDTGDINNDLITDVFATDLAFAGETREPDCDDVRDENDRRQCELNARLDRAVRIGDIDSCAAAPTGIERRECWVASILYLAWGTRDASLCARVPKHYPSSRRICEVLATSPVRKTEDNLRTLVRNESGYPQHQVNTLYVGRGGGKFDERGSKLGVAKTSWSWTGKFGDLDNDGFQDLYVANGVGGFAVARQANYPNYFFHNQNGAGMRSAAAKFGLDDPLHTSSFVYVDFDGDGDLDVIATGFNAPVRVYKNNESTNRSILFELRDERGNSHGIGGRITISAGGKKQFRELKLGGGYLAFDPPIAHFGLGANDRVTSVEVRWPNGQVANFEGEFAAGRRYRITRRR